MGKSTPIGRDIDYENGLWFKRHRVKYCFTAETSLKINPEDVDRSVYGHFIRAPFPREGVARWGFIDEKGRDAFVKRFKGRLT